LTITNLAKTMNRLLNMMRLAGLSEYGRTPTRAEDMAVQAQVYAKVLVDRKIELEWWKAGADHLIGHSGDFPTAAQFADACELARERATYIASMGYNAQGRLVGVRVQRGIQLAELQMMRETYCRQFGLLPDLPKEIPSRCERIDEKHVESKMIMREPVPVDVAEGLENARKFVSKDA
jgi:hypothetical protein